MKIYLHHDTGSAYRLNFIDAATHPNGVVEYRPLSVNNEVIDSEDGEWYEVDYYNVGNEEVRHEGRKMTIKELEPIIRAALA